MSDVLIAIIFVLCIIIAISVVSMKKSGDDTLTLFGYQLRVVETGSMEKCDATDVGAFEIKDIPTNSMVFIKELPESDEERYEWYSSLKTGDVLTFKYTYDKQYIITHRVTAIKEATPEQGGGYEITLAGDNVYSPDSRGEQVIYTGQDRTSGNYVIGKVTGVSYPLGWFITNVRKPLGIMLVIILPCLAIAAFEVVKIVRVFASDKQTEEQASENTEGKENEQ